jgi:hypothetical protein
MEDKSWDAYKLHDLINDIIAVRFDEKVFMADEGMETYIKNLTEAKTS